MNILRYASLAATMLLLAQPLSAASAELPSSVKDALNSALDDEYRAEAFYAAVIGKFGSVRPFSNIIKAEQTHAAMLRELMVAHGMPTRENTLLGQKDAASAVPQSIAEACKIGVKAEIDNAALYDDKLIPAAADYKDIAVTFKRLRDASQKRHLKAFKRCANR